MHRHIIDHDKQRSDRARAERFLQIERQERAHPASKELQRRAPGGTGAARLRAFLRIARGIRA
ncbi:hypothetical protein [Actibacterium sp. MT2.3-13A]|uniref:hypothetical protein n=1 Tax=Actibacterium sp. MT2.3-13A TaxID=2828332 RepID=UPI001BA5D1A1|nr:hypothetical protein [Actibacterium sp. MT2.3-13A]